MNLNNIFLVGFMASGKSSFGEKLARQLNYNFIDLDELINEQNGLSITQIFELEGEDKFRELETKALKSINITNTIISLGGGTPCFNDNFDIIKTKGISVYLELPTKILIGRIKQDKEQRPLVKYLDEVEIIEKTISLFNKRESIYKKSDLTIDATLSNKKMKDLIIDFI